MRWNEARYQNIVVSEANFNRDGIDVTDEKGKVLGKSPKAGFNALTQVSISRVMTSLPGTLYERKLNI